MPSRQLPELLTAAELADILRVRKEWIYRAVRKGELPHIRLGRYVRFDRADIDEWLRGGGSKGLE